MLSKWPKSVMQFFHFPIVDRMTIEGVNLSNRSVDSILSKLIYFVHRIVGRSDARRLVCIAPVINNKLNNIILKKGEKAHTTKSSMKLHSQSFIVKCNIVRSTAQLLCKQHF